MLWGANCPAFLGDKRMKKEELLHLATRFVQTDKSNTISSQQALAPQLAGRRMYDEPLMAVASAGDPLFEALKADEAVGPLFLLPQEWLPDAASVISLFFPTSAWIRKDNRQNMSEPSPSWLHARIEGQAMILRLTTLLQNTLRQAGHHAVAPVLSDRFAAWEGNPPSAGAPAYGSNWSERHVAYVCGLGTFGLSKGLITAKGVTGRFTSIITSLALTPNTRPYSSLYEYCSQCGACAKNCPVGAISLQTGKSHLPCGAFLDKMRAQHKPRYGCGKCQVAVPCEAGPCTSATAR